MALNLKRRHLTREQVRELIAAECELTPDASDREIARRLGCDHKTVGAVRRPVSNLDTTEEVGKFPTLSRDEAEELTQRIQSELNKIDQLCIDLLTDGVPPTTVAETLMRMAKSAQTFDEEIADAMWRHMIAPRVTAILSWPPTPDPNNCSLPSCTNAEEARCQKPT